MSRWKDNSKQETVIKGNWRAPKTWSGTAQWVRNSENTKFYGEPHPRARKLIDVLVEDLYVKILPFSVAQTITGTPMLLRELQASVNVLLDKYGKLDLVYGDVPEKFRGKIIVDGRNLALVKAKCSMPMGEFLAWLKGNPGVMDKDTLTALSEWSGVPIEKMDTVYNTIVEFLRSETIEDHILAEKYSHGGTIPGTDQPQQTAPTNVVNVINPTIIF